MTHFLATQNESISSAAARVSDKPGRIRITGGTIVDFKTAEAGDRLGACVRLAEQP
jgi:hypothetical protein